VRGAGAALAARPSLQTEFPFVLPKGFVDREGNVHREGTMRLATANDEIAPLRDPRVRQNEAYMTIIVLSRVVTRLGSLPDVNPGVMENIFSADLNYLQGLYRQINETGDVFVNTTCPDCGNRYQVAGIQPAGES
jgi:hypothetical protein